MNFRRALGPAALVAALAACAEMGGSLELQQELSERYGYESVGVELREPERRLLVSVEDASQLSGEERSARAREIAALVARRYAPTGETDTVAVAFTVDRATPGSAPGVSLRREERRVYSFSAEALRE